MTTNPPAPAASARSRTRWLVLCAAVTGVALLLDQATKLLVRAQLELGETWPAGWELIRLSHVRNTGAAFGFLPNATTFLTIASIIASVVLVVVIVRVVERRPWQALCLSLILAGTAGNGIERIRLGYVTDFIDPMRYPSFNLADSSIVVGLVALIVLTFFEDGEQRAPATEDHAPPRREYEAG